MCLANAAYVKTKLKMNCHEHNQIEHQELSVYQGLFKRKVRCSEKKTPEASLPSASEAQDLPGLAWGCSCFLALRFLINCWADDAKAVFGMAGKAAGP